MTKEQSFQDDKRAMFASERIQNEGARDIATLMIKRKKLIAEINKLNEENAMLMDESQKLDNQLSSLRQKVLSDSFEKMNVLC